MIEGKKYINIFTGAEVLLLAVEKSSVICGKTAQYKKLTQVKEGRVYFPKPLNVFEQTYKLSN